MSGNFLENDEPVRILEDILKILKGNKIQGKSFANIKGLSSDEIGTLDCLPELGNVLGDIRLLVGYQALDLEATGREAKYLREVLVSKLNERISTLQDEISILRSSINTNKNEETDPLG